MSRIVVLGDIHGRTIWKDIIEKEQFDQVIFLGDYVSTHEEIPAEQQLSNLEDILNYKENNSDRVILLRGNHDVQILGYSWAECSGFDRKVYQGMIPMKEKFLELTQWVYHIPDTNIVCSHAGISEEFLDNVCKHFKSKEGWDFNIYDTDQLIEHINDIEPCELFGFTPCKMSDYCGDSATQPCTWIRPNALAYHGIKEVVHVVGHTPVAHICNLHNEAMIKAGYPEDGPDIWMCDTLGTSKEYLVIENSEFKSYKI